MRQGPSCSFHLFTFTPKQPTRWRRYGRYQQLPPINSADDIDQVLRLIAVHPFLAEERILQRRLTEHGHLEVGGTRAKIVVTGVATKHHYNRLEGELLEHLRSRLTPAATPSVHQDGSPAVIRTSKLAERAVRVERSLPSHVVDHIASYLDEQLALWEGEERLGK